MLRLFRNNMNRFLGMILLALISLSMLFFGMSFGGPQEDSAAIQIGDRSISFSEIARKKRQIQDRYRQMFGENYNRIAESLEKNLSQQVVDSTISDILFEEQAKAFDLAISDRDIASTIKAGLFPDRPYNDAEFQNMLRQLGYTPEGFLQRVESDLLRSQFLRVFEDIPYVSKAQAKTEYLRDNRKYNVSYVKFVPGEYVNEVPKPEAAELENFYLENSTTYETSETTSYQYILFPAEEFKEKVELLDEDIELYYADHADNFKTSEAVTAKRIILNFPKEDDPVMMAEVGERAREAHGRAVAGEDFSLLVTEYSDDITTKALGGDIGRVERGQEDKEFDKAVFALKGPGIADLISTSSGYQIVKIEEYIESRERSLEEVREEITSALKTLEAPAYARIQAEESYDQFLGGSKDLASLAKELNLKVQTAENLTAETDPGSELKGLTKLILEQSDTEQQLHDLGDLSIIVQLMDYREADIPDLDAVKEKVLEDYRKEKSVEVARKKADAFLQKFSEREDEAPSFENTAAEEGLSTESETEITRTNPKSIFSTPSLRTELFTTTEAGEAPKKVHETGGMFVVFQVTEMIDPASSEIEENLKSHQERSRQEQKTLLTASLLNQLKHQAEIDIKESVLSSQ